LLHILHLFTFQTDFDSVFMPFSVALPLTLRLFVNVNHIIGLAFLVGVLLGLPSMPLLNLLFFSLATISRK
jgi:hypothetical protein